LGGMIRVMHLKEGETDVLQKYKVR